MPLQTIASYFDPLRDLYRGPHYGPLPVRQVHIANIFSLNVGPAPIEIRAADARRLMAWAPDGILRLPAPDAPPAVAPGATPASVGMAFAAGCLAGASMISAPIYTALLLS